MPLVHECVYLSKAHISVNLGSRFRGGGGWEGGGEGIAKLVYDHDLPYRGK